MTYLNSSTNFSSHFWQWDIDIKILVLNDPNEIVVLNETILNWNPNLVVNYFDA